jgi:hypothetical protein
MNKINPKSVISAFILSSALLTTGACTVIDSRETTNSGAFNGSGDLETRLNTIQVGMSKDEVFSAIGLPEQRMQRLNRAEIKVALYGSPDQELEGTEEQVRQFFSDIEGYSFRYRDIDKDRSLTASFKVKTESEGTDMRVSLVFKSGKLYDRPDITGGVVNDTDRDPIIKINRVLSGSVGL